MLSLVPSSFKISSGGRFSSDSDRLKLVTLEIPLSILGMSCSLYTSSAKNQSYLQLGTLLVITWSSSFGYLYSVESRKLKPQVEQGPSAQEYEGEAFCIEEGGDVPVTTCHYGLYLADRKTYELVGDAVGSYEEKEKIKVLGVLSEG